MFTQGEKNGVHYNFVTRQDFESYIKGNRMLEYGEYSGNLYGTMKYHSKETAEAKATVAETSQEEATVEQLFDFMGRVRPDMKTATYAPE